MGDGDGVYPHALVGAVCGCVMVAVHTNKE